MSPEPGLAGAFAISPGSPPRDDVVERARERLPRAAWRWAALGRRGFLACRSGPESGRLPGPPGETLIAAARGFAYSGDGSIARTVRSAHGRHELDFPAWLEGQYAAAGFEPRRDRLWLTVDPFGARQLFYLVRSGTLCFADDLELLVGWCGQPRTPCPHAVHAYFSLFHVPPPRTWYRDVRQVVPGSVLVAEEGALRSLVLPWSAPCGASPRSREEALDGLEEILAERLGEIGRVSAGSGPLGLLFSGGTDSGLLGALLGRGLAHALGDGDGGEIAAARSRAATLGLPFRAWRFAPAGFGLPEAVVARRQEPIFPFAGIYIDWFLDRVARRSGALVCGSGADGIFFGDPVLRALIREHRDESRGAPDGPRVRRRDALRATRLFRPASRMARRVLYTEELKQAIGVSAAESVLLDLPAGEPATYAEVLVRQYLAFSRHALVTLCVAGTGGRCPVHFPFLSQRLMRWVLSLPPELRGDDRRGSGDRKPLLESLLLRRVPGYPLLSPKQGFGHSISIRRLFDGPAVAEASAYVEGSGLHDARLLRPEAVRKVFEACRDPSVEPGLLHLAWGILALAVWYRRQVSGERGR